METDTTAEQSELSWSKWYGLARSQMEFTYGIRRIPKDRWKEQYALGKTPHGAARAIYNERADW